MAAGNAAADAVLLWSLLDGAASGNEAFDAALFGGDGVGAALTVDDVDAAWACFSEAASAFGAADGTGT